MGCGASNDAKPTPVVPAAVAQDPSKPHRVHVGIPNQAQNGLPPGLASFKNSPQAANGGINSNSNFPNGLAPLKTTPVLGSRTASNNPPSIDLSNVPPGSQIPGLNYCNSDFFPTHMEQVWAHYARPPDYKLIDKSGLKSMAEDAVNSFLDAAKKWIQQDNPRWSTEKVETKLNFLRGQFLPGLKLEDSVVIATHFFAHELKFQSSEDGKASGVTKPCFFLHFQRAHRQLFSFTAGAQITLERELLVQRLNKQGVDRANKGLKSLTAKSSVTSGLASSKGSKSVKASARHKSKKSAGSKDTKPNIFGELDFNGPPTSIQERENSTSKK